MRNDKTLTDHTLPDGPTRAYCSDLTDRQMTLTTVAMPPLELPAGRKLVAHMTGVELRREVIRPAALIVGGVVLLGGLVQALLATLV